MAETNISERTRRLAVASNASFVGDFLTEAIYVRDHCGNTWRLTLSSNGARVLLLAAGAERGQGVIVRYAGTDAVVIEPEP
jgi:hypothetical protein